jgi:hypothetical protein
VSEPTPREAAAEFEAAERAEAERLLAEMLADPNYYIRERLAEKRMTLNGSYPGDPGTWPDEAFEEDAG